MKSYNELKTDMEDIQEQILVAKKNEPASAIKEVNRLCREFGFIAGMDACGFIG